MKKNIKIDVEVNILSDDETTLAQVFGYTHREFSQLLDRTRELMKKEEYYNRIFNRLLTEKESGILSDRDFLTSLYFVGILQGRSTQIMSEKITNAMEEMSSFDQFDDFLDGTDLKDNILT